MVEPSLDTTVKRALLAGSEKRSVAVMIGVIVLITAVGWLVLGLLVAPAAYSVGGGQVLGIGLGLTSYLLGMRHAFDADHIAAIDNTTRKLLADAPDSRRRPLGVGFWFALGHSTVVFVQVLLLALGVRAIAGETGDDDSPLRKIGGIIGTSVSGVFLIAIGVINLIVLIGILRVFQNMRRGHLDEAALEHQLNNRGFMNRLLGGVTKAVRRPVHMYPAGFLFGLGFDTATEVALLVIAGGAAASSLPWYAILVLPVLFAAGMSLFDTLDGVFMCFAYDWAFMKPVRKVFYNITITSLSVAVALIIGVIELISILTDQLNIDSGPLAWIANLNLDYVGLAVVGLFILTWVGALLFWRLGNVEEKWTARLQGADSSE